MAIDYEKGVRPNVFELMQGGGGYELPPATDETLGGVIIGRGIDVEQDGTISVTAPAPIDTYTKEEIDAQQAVQNSNIAANTVSITETNAAIGDIESDIADITGDYAPRITSLENSQAVQDRTISAIQSHQQQQDTAISVNASTILTLLGDVSSIQTDMDAIEAQQQQQDASISANTGAISDLNDELDVLKTTVATDSDLGLIKTDSAKGVIADANGVLEVQGRLGQTEAGGLYYPTSINPLNVEKNSLLITEATSVDVAAKRIFALAGGTGVNLKQSAAAGSSVYVVQNTYDNRFICACARGGYATINESTAEELVVRVIAVYLQNDPDKTPLVPYSGATEGSNPIVIETEASANPDAATAKLRLYGSMSFDSAVQIGQGVGTGGIQGKGKIVSVGQGHCILDSNTIAVGNGIFSDKPRSAIFGAGQINRVACAFLAGLGQDTTNGSFRGLGAIGTYSLIDENTAFAIGNGTGSAVRSNLFEITNEPAGGTGIVVKSPNDTAYKITVDDSGNLSVNAV